MGVLTPDRPGRRLVPLDVPGGSAVLGVLPVLERALAGNTEALLPVPLDGPERSGPLRGLAPGTPLAPGEDDPADPTAFVLATSGSTGTPKGALLPVSALLASIDATADRLDPSGPSRPGQWLLALAPHHVAGLQVLLRSVHAGTEPVVLDLAVSFTPARFLAAAGAMTGPRRYVSLVPTQLTRILQHAEATAALAGFDAVLVGGAATAQPLLAQARAAGVPVVTTYGMSETCGGCVYDGVPLAGVRVEIQAPAGEPGPVVLHGPVVARGYRGRPDHPAFVGRAFSTGDLGRLVDGQLAISGRADDVIITGGAKLEPGVLERALARLPGVADVGVSSWPDPEWGQAVVVAIVPHPDAGPDEAQIRAAAAELGRFAVPKHVLWVDALPLRGIGKPDRRALAALVHARLAAPGQPEGRAAGSSRSPSR